MEIQKTNEMNTLLIFYGDLLTEKQRVYIELYYAEDFSLGEIAGHFNLSRQAVYDNIRRTGDLLEEYESKLGLYHKFEQRQAIYEEMLQLTKLHNNAQRNQQLEAYIEQLQRIE